MKSELSSRIDIAALSGTADAADVELACSLARSNECRSVVVNPCFAALSRKHLAGTDIQCVATTSFPLGTDLLAVTLYAAQQSILAGCSEILLALNMGQVLSGERDPVAREIQLVYASVDSPVGVYVNASLLEDSRLAETAGTAAESGAAYIVLGTQNVSAASEQIRRIADATGRLAHVRLHGTFESVSVMEDLISAGADGFVMDYMDAKTILD